MSFLRTHGTFITLAVLAFVLGIVTMPLLARWWTP